MAVEAVASVVIQKLTDMLKEESIMHHKVIVDHLEEIKKTLESKKGYLIDAEDKLTDPPVKDWAEKYLQHLYDVEDTIETFALRFARQRKRLGFLINHAMFLKNFTACKILSRKINKIRGQIKMLNHELPHGLADASVNSRAIRSRTFELRTATATSTSDDEIMNGGVADQIEEEHKDAVEMPKDAVEMQTKAFCDSEINLCHHNHQRRLRIRSDASLFAARSSQRRLNSHYSLFADRYNHCRLNSLYYDEEVLDLVGFQNDVPDLVERLTDANHLSTRVVSIVGQKGSGKTTLARAVYGNRHIKECFQSCSAWVTVCKECNAIVDVLLNLLKQVGNPKVDQGGPISTDKQALKSILDSLKDKKYLIVLDDFESSEMWDDLQSAFPDNRNGSKILLVTCEKAVATHANSQLHTMKKLSHEDSWELFLKKAGKEGPENLKQRIPGVCSHLPLNIVLLGSLLSTKQGKDEDEDKEWRQTLSTQDNWETQDIIALSYNDLPVHSKLCLLYMVLFPKEFDIPVRRLQRLWLAEGFVKRPDKSSSSQTSFQEDMAKQYFDDLVQRSLIQVSKLTSDGSPKRCRVLGAIHDHLVPKAKAISLFHVYPNSDTDSGEVAGPFGTRRLVQYTDINKWDPSQLRCLRSYLSFNNQYKDTPAREVGILLDDMIANGLRLLRVLDLEGVYKPCLPENLGDFFHLRYLGLRWTFLDALPESVGQLHYLETLDIKRTCINSLPPFIWKLKHLKHLSANGIRLDLPSWHGCSSLPRLLTLWGISIDDESLVKDGLNSLVHLRELGISFNLKNPEGLLNWISSLTAIQTLRVQSKDDTGRPRELIFKPLSHLEQLTNLNLMGILRMPPKNGDFPQKLKVLTLSVSQLPELGDPMPILGQLPELTVLRLLADSYRGRRMRCPQGGFKALRVLKLWMLKKLEEWDVEEGAMARLKELNIRCCDRLKRFPWRLLRERTFKELTLTNMPEAFRKQARDKKSDHVFLTVKDYGFSPLPWERAEDSPDGVNSALSNHNGHVKN